MKRTYSLRKYGKQLVAVALATVALGMAGIANADSWQPTTPDQIEIVPGQSSYTLKAGDTLWAVSQKLNLTVDFLAEVNGINLTLGEERNLPVGRVISWSVVAGQEVVKVDGVNYPVADVDKIDSAEAVGVQQVILLPDKVVDGSSPGAYTAVVLPFKPNLVKDEGKVEKPVDFDDDFAIDDSVKKTKNLYTFLFFDKFGKNYVNLYQGETVDDLQFVKKLDLIGRDPSLIKHDGVYYIAFTGYNLEKGVDFRLVSTKDFETFDSKSVSLGLVEAGAKRVWAPDFFRDDDGSISLFMSVSDGRTEADVEGRMIPYFETYVSKVNDLETASFENPVKVNLEEGNKIDPHVIKVDDTYKMLIKDEYSKETEIWNSSDMVNWDKQTDSISAFDGKFTEGAFVVEEDSGYKIFADAHKEGVIYSTETTDFTNFSEPEVFDPQIENKVAHGTGFKEEVSVVSENEEKESENLVNEN